MEVGGAERGREDAMTLEQDNSRTLLKWTVTCTEVQTERRSRGGHYGDNINIRTRELSTTTRCLYTTDRTEAWIKRGSYVEVRK